jgi:hypothetical protein
MADEIEVLVDVTLRNGNVENDFNPDTVIVDQSNARFVDKILDIGTSAETISFDDISTEGYVMLQNVDSSNYVTLGPDSGGQVNLLKLDAGDVAVFRIDPAAVLKATADTATVKLRVVCYEN